MTPPNYRRVEVKGIIRRLFAMRERCDSKDIHVRVLDVTSQLLLLGELHPDEYEALVVCGLYGTTFRDAEEVLGVDHVTIKSRFDSGIAHLTDALNGEDTISAV